MCIIIMLNINHRIKKSTKIQRTHELESKIEEITDYNRI